MGHLTHLLNNTDTVKLIFYIQSCMSCVLIKCAHLFACHHSTTTHVFIISNIPIVSVDCRSDQANRYIYVASISERIRIRRHDKPITLIGKYCAHNHNVQSNILGFSSQSKMLRSISASRNYR